MLALQIGNNSKGFTFWSAASTQTFERRLGGVGAVAALLSSPAGMASSAEPSAAAQQYELERLMASHELDIVALQAAGLVVHEVFENERWSPVLKTWGSSYPGHLQPADPMPFTNRLQ